MTLPTATPVAPPVVTDAPVPLSTETLAAAGAAPVQVDVQAMYAQIQKMQAVIDRQSAALGVPTNPIGAAVTNLLHHVKARAAANPGFDFQDLLAQLTPMADDNATVVTKTAELVSLAVDDALDRGRQLEGLDYLKVLARDLKTEVVKAS